MTTTILLICFISTVFSCGPGLISDSEYLVSMSGLDLPFSFVYSTSNIDGISAPTSMGDVIQNINGYCQDLVEDLMRVSLKAIDYPAYLLESAISSLDIQVASDYQPLSCVKFVSIFDESRVTTVAPKKEKVGDNNTDRKIKRAATVETGPKGNYCYYNTANVITKICENKGTKECTLADAVSLPLNVSRINFDFTPGILAGQPRAFWKDFSDSLAKKLKSGTYSSAFKQVSVDVKINIIR
ncbi:unnamed protein product [Caenorhabditis angaria]|uniref:DUF19 domain-containing protein n=1 Tax=Caenorhabditis angaria TaxID=860376 RepID=A0A9P1ICL0_9PELO|nr:unnamed protein product [Caenorhabditis angaria]